LTTYVSQGSVATDLRGGGSFKSTFLCRFFLNLIVKKLQKLVEFADVLSFGARRSGNYDSPCSMNSKTSYLRTTINISTQSLNYTLYIPLTDILFTSVFIEENSFTAFMTCVTMIFLPTDATSFSSNNNVTKQHQCNYATDNAHTHTHSFVLAPECQCPNSRQCDCLNNELPKDTTDQGLN